MPKKPFEKLKRDQNPTDIDVVLVNVDMPNLSIDPLKDYCKDNSIPFIILTTSFDVERAVSFVKQGAFDYLVWPITDEKLLKTIEEAVQVRQSYKVPSE